MWPNVLQTALNVKALAMVTVLEDWKFVCTICGCMMCTHIHMHMYEHSTHTHAHTHTRTNSMELSHSWEMDSSKFAWKLCTLHGNQRFITVLTRSRHLSLHRAKSICISLRSTATLSSLLCLDLPGGFFLPGVPTKILVRISPPYLLHAPPITTSFTQSPEEIQSRPKVS